MSGDGRSGGQGVRGPLPERLQALRASAGLTQEQLAQALGVAFSTVNRWERGRTSISAAAERRLAALEGRPVDGGTARPTGWPAPASSFVGRRDELAQLQPLLATTRLLCLTGPGGVGKTRLATELLGRHQARAVTFVALETVQDEPTLAAAVAAALGVRDRPGSDTPAGIEAALADGPRLLVLDGAEHVCGPVAALARRLLAAAPSLQLLVTSRRVLGLDGETSWPVPPLSCPPVDAGPEDIRSSDAVTLWVERARQRLPSFDPQEVPPRILSELCRHLDGLPLAIELSAGWVGTLSVGEILERRTTLLADDGEDTGAARTLGAVVRQSWSLLTPALQEWLPGLTAIASPFTIDDARAVTGVSDATAARLLRSLVESSWLAVTTEGERSRFAILDTMRAFAEEQVDPVTDPAMRRRHAHHFADLGRRSEDGLAGAEVASWITRLDAASADVERALGWASDQGDANLGLELSASLWRWWLISGRLATGRRWLTTFLDAAGRRHDEVVGRAQCAAAVLAAENGDYHDAVRLAEPALRSFEAYGRAANAALAATVIGAARRYLGDPEAARTAFQRALDLRRALDDERGVSVSLNNLALLALDAEEYAAAEELFDESIAVKRRLGDPLSVGIGLSNLSTVLIRAGKTGSAAQALSEAEALAGKLGNRQLIGSLHANRGDLAARLDDWEQAAAHYRAAASSQRAGGHAHDVVVALVGLGRALDGLGRRDEAVEQLRDAEALAEQTANADGLGKVRAALGELGERSLGPLPGGLTAREGEVLRLLAVGSSSKEIAAQLSVRGATVDRHLANIYRKLRVRGRVDAARWAVAEGLVSARSSRRSETDR